MNTKEELKRNIKYAKAYIILQRYENLFQPNTALRIGTIFKDLYRPYVENEK
ncbi:spore coat associated protein CotJA [Clostridium sp. K04]|uniref:spore coat associated protein CotJA n=1 Tax=Clostridium sp. K04 TaxID=2718929 RepID=UPI001C8C16C4|nr:spore coat associated protein CotJA [Clostridium sp. K04]MBX9184015.1 spore coat associated protein CotJA [Clostridium sp. K04]